MSNESPHTNHEVTVLEHDPRSVLDRIRKTESILHPGLLYSHQFPGSISEEEEDITKQEPEFAVECERNRRRFIDALRAIPTYLFKEFNLPRSNGVDIGCGPTGFMRNTLLEGQIDHHTWAELDANPHVIDDNRKLHPNSAMTVGSYHRMREMGLTKKLDMVTGLSSLDETAFLDHATNELAQTLRTGGWLLHIQDLRPGFSPCLQALEQRGIQPPYKIEAADRSGQNVISFDVQGEQVPVVELFRQRMAAALQKTPALEPVLNHWIVARKLLGFEESGNMLDSRTYYMNMLLQHMSFPGPIEEAYAVVTLARKK